MLLVTIGVSFVPMFKLRTILFESDEKNLLIELTILSKKLCGPTESVLDDSLSITTAS